ncbi:MAG: hypothetical protein ACLSAH_13820 [Bilophila wadsworthia]
MRRRFAAATSQALAAFSMAEWMRKPPWKTGSGNFGFDGVVQIPADAPQPAGTVKGGVQHLAQPRLGLDEILIGRVSGGRRPVLGVVGNCGVLLPGAFDVRMGIDADGSPGRRGENRGAHGGLRALDAHPVDVGHADKPGIEPLHQIQQGIQAFALLLRRLPGCPDAMRSARRRGRRSARPIGAGRLGRPR